MVEQIGTIKKEKSTDLLYVITRDGAWGYDILYETGEVCSSARRNLVEEDETVSVDKLQTSIQKLLGDKEF